MFSAKMAIPLPTFHSTVNANMGVEIQAGVLQCSQMSSFANYLALLDMTSDKIVVLFQGGGPCLHLTTTLRKIGAKMYVQSPCKCQLLTEGVT